MCFCILGFCEIKGNKILLKVIYDKFIFGKFFFDISEIEIMVLIIVLFYIVVCLFFKIVLLRFKCIL